MQPETACPECGGLGWRGNLRGGEAFARTAEIAYAGRLPKRELSELAADGDHERADTPIGHSWGTGGEYVSPASVQDLFAASIDAIKRGEG